MTRRGRNETSTSTSDQPKEPSTDRPTPESSSPLFPPKEPPAATGPGLVGSLSPGNENPAPHPATPNWSGSDDAGPHAGDATRSPDYGSGRRSTPKRPGGLKKSEVKKITATAVRTAGGILNAFLTAANTAERDQGLWLPDQEDVDGMADPLAGLAARRAPEGTDNPDAVDIARLIAAVGGYIGKQLRKRAELRQAPPPPSFYNDLSTEDDDGAFPPRDDEPGDVTAFLSRRYSGETPTSPTTDSERTGA